MEASEVVEVVEGDDEQGTETPSQSRSFYNCTKCRKNKKACLYLGKPATQRIAAASGDAPGESSPGPCDGCIALRCDDECSGPLTVEEDAEFREWKENKAEKKRAGAAGLSGSPTTRIQKPRDRQLRNGHNPAHPIRPRRAQHPPPNAPRAGTAGSSGRARILQRLDGEESRIRKSILSWLVATNENLNMEFLIELLRVEEGLSRQQLAQNPTLEPSPITKDIHDEYRGKIESACNGCIICSEADGNIVRILPSFYQFLSGKPRNYQDNVIMASAHQTVAVTCIRYLMHANIIRDVSEGTPGSPREIVAQYMVRNMARHYHMADSGDTPAFLRNFLLNSGHQVRHWCFAYDLITRSGIQQGVETETSGIGPRQGITPGNLVHFLIDLAEYIQANPPQHQQGDEEMNSTAIPLAFSNLQRIIGDNFPTLAQ